MIFVGVCVIRTAESVVFTCCPPAPLARYVSIFKSSFLISISTSSVISGSTSQETNEEWRQPDESKGEIHTSRRTPFYAFNFQYTLFLFIINVTLLMPSSYPSKLVSVSNL